MPIGHVDASVVDLKFLPCCRELVKELPKFASELPQGFANFGIGTPEHEDSYRRLNRDAGFTPSVGTVSAGVCVPASG
jgi:hypothetical protein